MNRKLHFVFWVALTAMLSTGFQVYPFIDGWYVDNSSAAKTKIFVTYPRGTDNVGNNLPTGDPLFGAGNQTVDQLMVSIFNDFNNIDASFLTLVDDADGDFAAESANRRIIFEVGDGGGMNHGHHDTDIQDGMAVGCTVTLEDSLYSDAELYVDVATHEIGHCLGLDHPQDTVNARMSYYRGEIKSKRLLIDDIMGLIYLFPTDPKYADESSTWGFSCSRR